MLSLEQHLDATEQTVWKHGPHHLLAEPSQLLSSVAPSFPMCCGAGVSGSFSYDNGLAPASDLGLHLNSLL